MLKAVERCFSSVNSLTTVSQTSLTLPFPQQSQQQFSNILSTFPLPQQSLNSLSAISQQTWFLAPITQQYLQTISLSLSQSSLNTPIPPALQKQTHSLLDSLFIPAEFPQATPSTCFLNTISIRYFRKTGQYMHESLLTTMELPVKNYLKIEVGLQHSVTEHFLLQHLAQSAEIFKNRIIIHHDDEIGHQKLSTE